MISKLGCLFEHENRVFHFCKIIFFGILILAPASALAGGAWSIDGKTGCQAWVGYDQKDIENYDYVWSGACVDGKASGQGVLKINSKKGKKDKDIKFEHTCNRVGGICLGQMKMELIGSSMYMLFENVDSTFDGTGKVIVVNGDKWRYEGGNSKFFKYGYGEMKLKNGEIKRGIWVKGNKESPEFPCKSNESCAEMEANSEKYLAQIKGALANDFDFDDSIDIFTDKSTGLMWKRCAIGRDWDTSSKQCKGSTKNASWADMVRLVHDAKYAGFSDWRLPTAEEYKTLIGANGKFNCKEMKNTINRYFPNVYNRTMFGSNHWLADNNEDLMSPLSADLELVIGMLGCRITEDSLRPHAEQPAIMVRGGAVPEKWALALSKMHLTKEINEKSRADGKKYWDGVNKKVSDIFSAAPSGSASQGEQNFKCKIVCRTSGFVSYETKDLGEVRIKAYPSTVHDKMSEICNKLSGNWYPAGSAADCKPE